jgi:hypothetical protein
MLQVPDIHTKRLLDLANFIEDLDEERFSMRQWGQLSEPRCICGWYAHNEGHPHKDDWRWFGDRLGLDENMTSALVSPEHEWSTVEAARALRNLAVTGSFR